MSITGDPVTDQMVSIAIRMVGGVREWDAGEVAAAFDEARAVSPERGTLTLAVVLASMVPYDRSPRELLHWVTRRKEFDRLVKHGVDPATAASIIDGLEGGGGARPG